MSEAEHEIEAEEVEETEAENEPETGDEPEQAEDFEGVKTPAEQAAADEAAMVKQDKALTAEDKRHQTALGKAYGDSWPEHVRCAMCDGEGFMQPEAAQALTHDQWGELLQVAAMLVVEDYVQDPNYETCPNCKGKTKTRSGAQDSEHYLKICDVCSGNGYIPKQPVQPQFTLPAPITNGTESVANANPSYGSPAPDDPWGRHAGHPHYGIDPNYVITT